MKEKTFVGIITRIFPYKETDLIVHGVSPTEGRFSMVARHAKISQKRFAGLLVTFNLLEFQQTARAKVPTIESAHLLHSYARLAEDYPLFCRTAYLAETAETFSAEDHADPEIYSALEGALGAAEAGGLDGWGFARFLFLILRSAGVAPVLDRCVRSHTGDATDIHMFSLKEGGLVSADSVRPTDSQRDLIRLSDGLTTRLLGSAKEDGPLHEAAEMERILMRFVAHQLGRSPKSERFVKLADET